MIIGKFFKTLKWIINITFFMHGNFTIQCNYLFDNIPESEREIYGIIFPRSNVFIDTYY